MITLTARCSSCSQQYEYTGEDFEMICEECAQHLHFACGACGEWTDSRHDCSEGVANA